MTNLYVQTAFLGDLLLALPVLKQIRYWNAKSSLKVVCRKGYGSFLEKLEVCDEVYELDKNHQAQARRELSQQNYHTIFSPHQSLSTHRLVGHLKAQEKIGFWRFYNRFHFDQRVVRNLAWPEVMRQMQLLASVDENIAIKLESFAEQPNVIPRWAQMRLSAQTWNEEDLGRLKQKIPLWPEQKPIICLAPGSVWPTKRWSLNGFIQVAHALSQQGFSILLLGAANERALCESIHEQVNKSLVLAGELSIFESLMVLSQSQALICNDSGAMHLASLLHLPTVALFGPTVIEMGYKPWNPRAEVLHNPRLLCRPCGQHGGLTCPIGTHACMTSIEQTQVLQQLKDLLA